MNNIEFLDILNILSFIIGVVNLDENLSQGEAGELLKIAVEDIHKHLKIQDEKLDLIIKELENIKNEKDI